MQVICIIMNSYKRSVAKPFFRTELVWSWGWEHETAKMGFFLGSTDVYSSNLNCTAVGNWQLAVSLTKNLTFKFVDIASALWAVIGQRVYSFKIYKKCLQNPVPLISQTVLGKSASTIRQIEVQLHKFHNWTFWGQSLQQWLDGMLRKQDECDPIFFKQQQKKQNCNMRPS